MNKIITGKESKKVLEKFYLKYKNYIFWIFELLLLFGFFYFTNFERKSFDILFCFIFGIYGIYLLFFRIELVEEFIIKYFTVIMLSGIIYILYSQTQLKIENKDALLMIGGIIAFWYGYKKYEKDKEMEMIEKFQIGKLTIENFEDDISKLAIAYKLYKKGYIPNIIWELIEIKNDEIFYSFIKNNLSFEEKDLNKLKEEVKQKTTEISVTLGKLKIYPEVFIYFFKKLKQIESNLKCLLDKNLVIEKEIIETQNLKERITILIKLIEEIDKDFKNC